jgi:hypothetical protein
MLDEVDSPLSYQSVVRRIRFAFAADSQDGRIGFVVLSRGDGWANPIRLVPCWVPIKAIRLRSMDALRMVF